MARNRTAKNWTAYEAAKTIHEGNDFEAIVDIFKRFPVFGMECTKLNEAGLDILKALGDFTARKMNAYLRDAAGLSDDDSDENEEQDEKPVKKYSKKSDLVDNDEDNEDDDDDDDEEEEPTPKKRGRKPKKEEKKSSKKSKKSKKVDDDDDDDDDFDFDDD